MKASPRDKLFLTIASKRTDFYALKKQSAERFLGVPVRGKYLKEIKVPEQILGNLIGIGVSEKQSEGQACGVPSITFFVEEKVARNRLTKRERLPRTIDGVLCDVVACGALKPSQQDFRSYYPANPLRPGCEIGVSGDDGGLGTLGAFMLDPKGDVCLISNCHVLSPSDLASPGREVFQPAPGTLGSRKIADVTHVIPLATNQVNYVDLAVAKIVTGVPEVTISPVLPKLEPALGIGTLPYRREVEKYGAGSQETSGFYTAAYVDCRLPIKGRIYHFRDLQGFTPPDFARPGDSGSLVKRKDTDEYVSMILGESGINFGMSVQAIERALPGFKWIL